MRCATQSSFEGRSGRIVYLTSLINLNELPSTGIRSLDQIVGGLGYPEKSTVLVVGPPGIGKEALSYRFIQSGISQNDFCLYITRLSSKEVLEDTKAFNIDFSQREPLWFASDGYQLKFDISDLAGFSYNIKDILKKNSERRIRIVTDVISSLLMLNQPETIYKLLTQLFVDVKQYDAVVLATIEEGMHPPNVLASMQQLFDGFLEMSYYRNGLKILPLLRVGKMRGQPPQAQYFRISFTHAEMLLETTEAAAELGAPASLSSPQSSVASPSELQEYVSLLGKEATIVFQYLLKSFIEDYSTYKLSIDQSGWRTRVEIAEKTNLPQTVLYSRDSKYSPILKELLSKGLVEQRFYEGHRGRGGEVVKLRIAYEKELVKRFVATIDRDINLSGGKPS